MIRADLLERRLVAAARIEHLRAARLEFAAGRQVQQVRHHAWNRLQPRPALGLLDARDRGQEPLRVRVQGVPEQLQDGRLLHLAAEEDSSGTRLEQQ